MIHAGHHGQGSTYPCVAQSYKGGDPPIRRKSVIRDLKAQLHMQSCAGPKCGECSGFPPRSSGMEAKYLVFGRDAEIRPNLASRTLTLRR
jgi:hypothetical protein